MVYWPVIALMVLAGGYLAVSLFVAVRFSAPNREPPERTPADAGLEYREVSFESADRVPLEAWWVPPAEGESSRAAVLVHGWGGDKSDEHVIETAPIYARAGYGVLLLDLRGNGGSGGERRTLGYKETRDVQGALAWLDEEGFEPGEVVLHGWSMGGATVVRSAPGTGVAAVIEEAGYADLPLLLRRQLPETTGLPSLFSPGVFLAAKLFLGFDPWAVQPSEDAARLREEGVPLFVIHSTDDEVVPFEHAELFESAYPEARLWKIEGLGHVEAYTHREYRQKLLSFLSENLS
ncbi:MAG: alpha/beta fold hydrolase [Actinomycetota bacterium]|nr:alpha/beta fold hydrolase [Actinomycetota bacterium]MDQ5814477.1 alpha/beta fold hydrolase [Actinomycetota bacterium]